MNKNFLLFFILFLLAKADTTAQCTVTITPNGPVILCRGDSIILTASGAVSYTWAPGGSLSSTNGAVVSASPNATTTFTLTGNCMPGTDQATITVQVRNKPNASFTTSVNNVCSGTTANFTSTVTSGTAPFTYSWTFGGGGTSTLANPSNAFVSVGCGITTYTNTLIVTDANGCTDTVSNTINIIDAPDIQMQDIDLLSPFSNCDQSPSASNPNDTITINNISPSVGCIVNYTVDWGDGNVQAALAAGVFPLSHIYTSLGAFNLVVSALGTNGCIGSTTYVVANQANPAGGLSTLGSTSGCGPLTLPFLINNWQLNSPGTTYQLDFGDGTIVTLTHPLNLAGTTDTVYHTYTLSSCPATNFYTATLTVINSCDQTSYTASNIQIRTKPTASFTATPTPACLNVPVCFTNTTSGGYGPACSGATIYAWNFGDPASGAANTSALATPPCHTYTTAGTYTVTLTASNACGPSTVTQTVCVTPQPTPAFTLDVSSGCAPLNVAATNTSNTLNNCVPATYNWTITYIPNPPCGVASSFSFTGGSSATSTDAGFQFVNDGTYTITLSVTNGCGTFSASQNVIVNVPPIVAITPVSNSCGAATVTPTAIVTNCGLNALTYAWTFGGGVPATDATATPPSILFSANGNHTITLSVANECGATPVNTAFSISPQPTANAGIPVSICNGQSTNLSGSGIGGTPAYTYSWTSNPIGFTDFTQNPAVTPVATTTYSLTVTDANLCTAISQVVITVNPLPVVAVNSPSICIGSTTTLTASGANTYSWTAGATSTGITTADATPALTTSYTVTGTETATGCTNTAISTVTVNPLPIVNAGPSIVLCNQPIASILTGYSPLGGTWSGAGVTAGGVFTPTVNGNFILTYDYTDAITLCSSSDTMIITVINPQVANAGTGFTICSNAGIQALTGFTPAGGVWSGAGITGNSFDPLVSGAGSFILTYTFGTGSCLSSDTIQVTVNAQPTVTVNSPTICVGATTTLTATGATNYVWTAGAILTGITTADATPLATTTYTVTGTITATGCTNTAISTVTVNPLPVVNSGLSITVCNNPVATILTGFAPAGGTWSGTGVTAGGVFTPTAVGNFTLTYTYTDAITTCTSSDTMIATVINAQPAVAGTGFNICDGSATVALTGFSPAGGTWTGTGIVGTSFNPAVAGVGSFVLTYSFGAGTCLSTDTIMVTINPLPTVIVNSPTICFGQTATLTANGANTYVWTAGTVVTGVNTADASPAATSTFTVTGTTTATGCTNTAVSTVTVGALPIVAFTNPAVDCINNAVVFTNNSTGATTYSWNFGDGGTSVLATPSHTYTAAGNYTIKLIAYSVLGCSDSTTNTIQINDAPVANFTTLPNSGCAPLNVVFTNNSTGIITSYLWNFGNGNTSALALAPNQTYFQGIYDTTYLVTLSVTNNCGTSNYIDSVLVQTPPIVDFGTNLSSACSPFQVLMNNTTTGSPANFTWDFGDGTTSNLANPGIHPYTAGPNDSTYFITLIGTNGCGSDTMTRPLLILHNNVVAFFNTSPANGCAPHTVNFTDFSTGATFISWDFGDGITSTGANPSHTYTTPGTYICQQFADNSCNYDTTSITITIYTPPVISFTTSTLATCANNAINFVNTSIGALGFTWDFGDGGTSLLNNPTHTFAIGGNYIVTLVGTSGSSGCLDSTTQLLTIHSLPIPNIVSNVAFGCTALIVNFNNTTSNANFYFWNFGDGNTSALMNPSHTYTTTGFFNVTMVATNLNGCIDSAIIQINVYPDPVASFTTSSAYGCLLPSTINFTNTSTGATGYNWNFGNSTTSTLTNPTTTYTANGNYSITLIATTSFGCDDTTSQSYSVYLPPLAGFTANPTSGCQPLTVTFTNQCINTTTYLWNFGNGDTSTVSSPSYTYTNSGTYSITLIAANATSCTDTMVLTNAVTVNPAPVANFTFTQLYQNDIANGTINYLNLSTSAANYLWDFGDGNSSTLTDPVHQYNGVGSFTTVLIATNQYNCSDTAMQLVTPDYFSGLFVPNALMPGNTGDAHLFLPKGKSLKTYRLQIVNTWGTVLFETTALDAGGNPSEGWDGTYNGVPCQQDVYVWKIDAMFLNGEFWQGKLYEDGKTRNTGTVTLIK